MGGLHQCGTEESTYAGGPTYREYDAENQGGKEAHVSFLCSATAVEKIQAEYAQEIQTEENNDQTGNDIDSGLMFMEEAADGTCQSTHGNKHQGKTQNKAEGGKQGLSGAPFFSAGEIGDIYGKHREQARGKEGDDPFQKGDKVLHGKLLLKENISFETTEGFFHATLRQGKIHS